MNDTSVSSVSSVSQAYNLAMQEEDAKMGMGMGSNADFRNVDNDSRLRRFAILRRCWKLLPEERTWITGFFMRATSASKLVSLLNEDHPWKDRVEYNSKLYDLELIEMSLQMIEDAAKASDGKSINYLISVRENSLNNFNVFLVKKILTPAANWVGLL